MFNNALHVLNVGQRALCDIYMDHHSLSLSQTMLFQISFPLDPARPSLPKLPGKIDRADPVFLLEGFPAFVLLGMVKLAHRNGITVLNFEAHSFGAGIVNMSCLNAAGALIVVDDAATAAQPLEEALGNAPSSSGSILFAGSGVDSGHDQTKKFTGAL